MRRGEHRLDRAQGAGRLSLMDYRRDGVEVSAGDGDEGDRRHDRAGG